MTTWRLIVRKGTPHHAALHRLGLRPTKKNPNTYIGRYDDSARAQLMRHIDMLKANGLHGVALRGTGA